MSAGRVASEAVLERLAGLVAGLFAGAALMLLVVSATADQSTTVTGALLALAVAALVRAAQETTDLVARTTTARVSTRRPVPIVLATRATDPTHHPLRPRAPGTV